MVIYGQPFDSLFWFLQVGPVPTSDGKDSVVTVRILLDISGIVTLDSTALVSATVIITFRVVFCPNLL